MASHIDAWKGAFGDAYHARNNSDEDEVVKRMLLWTQALQHLLKSRRMDILEVGAGMGANLEAIHSLYQAIDVYPRLHALEPNDFAREHLAKLFSVVAGTADHIEAKDRSFDLVFTYGVLIHLNEYDMLTAMAEMIRVSRRYVMCAEYFSPQREDILYRDSVPLSKDDFGAHFIDNFDVELVDYGFCWKVATGLDNVTWWLFERRDWQQRMLGMTAG